MGETMACTGMMTRLLKGRLSSLVIEWRVSASPNCAVCGECTAESFFDFSSYSVEQLGLALSFLGPFAPNSLIVFKSNYGFDRTVIVCVFGIIRRFVCE